MTPCELTSPTVVDCGKSIMLSGVNPLPSVTVMRDGKVISDAVLEE